MRVLWNRLLHQCFETKLFTFLLNYAAKLGYRLCCIGLRCCLRLRYMNLFICRSNCKSISDWWYGRRSLCSIAQTVVLSHRNDDTFVLVVFHLFSLTVKEMFDGGACCSISPLYSFVSRLVEVICATCDFSWSKCAVYVRN